MSKVPQKLNMPTAVTTRSNMSFPSVHVTTGNFMELSVAHYRELVPSQEYTVEHSCFSRLDPMNVPTFGFCKMYHKAFFVPYRTVMPAFTDLVNDTMHVFDDGHRVIPQKVHSIKNSLFVQLFTENLDYAVYIDGNQTTVSDLQVVFNASTLRNYNLTPKGRHAYKLLQQLGYGVTWSIADVEHYHSALPLFSLARIYVDWYYPSQYVQLDEMGSILALLKYDSYANGFEYTFTLAQLTKIFDMLYRNYYENDLYTNAWDKPNMPNYNGSSIVSINDIADGTTDKNQILSTDHAGVSTYGTGQSPKIVGGTSASDTSGVTSISQFALTALRSLTDYMKRHQIAGARNLDRFLSRWGIKLDADKIDRSYYLGGWMQEVQFGDVTSTSDTEGAPLGAYAGKGIVRDDNGNFKFTATEYGMFIIVTSIVPDILYYQGADRTTTHLTKLDFYTPEFDNLGVQAMAANEVYIPNRLTDFMNGPQFPTGIDYNNYVFGFVPRYSEYKTGRDFITGDFRRGSVNVGKDAWTLGRNLQPLFTSMGSIRHDINFIHAQDAEQFNRIFNIDNGDIDHFNIIHRFKITTNFPGKSLYDSYEFKDEDRAKHVSLDIDGVKTN